METILVVDDEPLVLNLCNVALTRAGYGVIMASDGKTALELCREGDLHVDLALVDAAMPDMTGADLADCLRALGVRVVVMSGYSRDQVEERIGRSINYDKYLAKPFSQTTLKIAVQEA